MNKQRQLKLWKEKWKWWMLIKRRWLSFILLSLSKSTWGEQPVQDIPNFTCICVYLFASRLLAKRKTIQTWNLSHMPYLKTGFLFYQEAWHKYIIIHTYTRVIRNFLDQLLASRGFWYSGDYFSPISCL